MASAKFALEAGGPKRLEVSWRGLWKDISVQLDGEEIGHFADKDALLAGQTFTLPDGSDLHVQLVQSFGNVELQVTRDGKPLPGSASDPATRVQTAGYTLYFIAGLSALIGGLAVIFKIDFLIQMGVGWPALAEAGVFAVLGYFTLRNSKPALIIAIALYILDGVLGIVASIDAKGTPSAGMIFMRVILLLGMFRALPAMDELKKKGGAAAPANAGEEG